MNTTILQNGGPGSATIYQFPVGGRSAASDGRPKEKASTDLMEHRVSSSSWYHDAAIQESKWTRDH